MFLAIDTIDKNNENTSPSKIRVSSFLANDLFVRDNVGLEPRLNDHLRGDSAPS